MRSFLRAKNNDAAELAHFAAPKIASGIYLLHVWQAVAFWQQTPFFSNQKLNLIQVRLAQRF
jgi:hypothetical protein